MVAISIIGILSSIVYANFGSARKSSRDDIRKTSLKEMQLAIEFYKAQNDKYPDAGCTVGNNTYAEAATCANYVVGLVPDYIPALPTDPSGSVSGKGFMYRSDGSSFKLLVKDSVEVKTLVEGDEYGRCPTFSGCSGNTTTYAAYSAGAVTW